MNIWAEITEEELKSNYLERDVNDVVITFYADNGEIEFSIGSTNSWFNLSNSEFARISELLSEFACKKGNDLV